MKTLAKVVSALSFAHLSGIGRASKAAAEDDKKPAERDHEDGNAKKAEKRDDETDDQYAKRMKAEDEEQDESSKAEGDEKDEGEKDEKDKAKAEADDEDDADKKDKATAKASAEDDEKDDDSEKDEKARAAHPAAFARATARCAAIFASPAAARNPVLAANLAFKTRMTRAEALALLESTPGSSPASASRASRNPNIGSGAGEQVTGAQAVAKSWDRAFAQVAPPKRK